MATKIGTTKISNSHRGKRFTVSKSDIQNGQPNDPCACAAARALRREFNAKEVFVYRNVVYILNKDGSALRFKTPPDLARETIVFDRNGEFFPGEYDLQPAPMTEVTRKKSKATSGSRSSGRTSHKGGYRKIPNVRPTASQKLPGA